LSESFERLTFFVVALFGLSHIFGCIWIFIGRTIGEEGWVTQNEFDELVPFSLYLTALYFTFTTISTVGFGDISGGATSEKLYCILILFIGVLAYSFIAGSITSIIISYESTSHANLQSYVTLNRLLKEHSITPDLYNSLKKAVDL
jgi:hypothetical protein